MTSLHGLRPVRRERIAKKVRVGEKDDFAGGWFPGRRGGESGR